MSSAATTELLVNGMTCNNCARKVTAAAQNVPGVHSISVNIAAAHASVRWSAEADRNIAAVLEAISRAGFDAKELSSNAEGGQEGRWQWNLIIGLGVTGLLMIGEWGFNLTMTSWFQWLAFVLAGVVQVFCGAGFYSGAWRQLKAGQSNMDTLVALGSTTAFGYSTWALLSGADGHVYFMEAAAIISLVSFGHWLEARVSDKAGSALKSLLNLAPQTARRIQVRTPGGSNPASQLFNLRNLSFSKSEAGSRKPEIEEEVAVSDLKVDDQVVLRPGDRVPVDGVVIEGESALDEAMLTGESIPVDKKTGSELFAGTVNLNGRLVLRVMATGEGTALAHIVAAVQRAQTSRANIQRIGDSISNVFVPVIVVVALAAGLWWGLAPASIRHIHDFLSQYFWHAHAPVGVAAGFIVAAAVLIVACPCAMGLATPAAIMASANAAARRGILIRDGVALEKAGSITAVVFDKTGTLTNGKPEVAAVWQSMSDAQALSTLAHVLARHSNHPISHAVASHFEKVDGIQTNATASMGGWHEIRGSGIEGKLETGGEQATIVRLGSLRWLRELGISFTKAESFISEWTTQGATVVGLARGAELVALFSVRDAMKPHAVTVVVELRQQGLKTYLVTGDNSSTAAAIAKQAGIASENVFAEVRPEEKSEFVKTLQAKGERVAFVGDGINDAPALTQADLGIAVSRASDVAREAADIILLKSEIEAVPEALGLARATLRTIKQNLFWAFFYNALSVPLAALGFISPVVCAAAMGFSDLIVIGNALRLLRWRPKKA